MSSLHEMYHPCSDKKNMSVLQLDEQKALRDNSTKNEIEELVESNTSTYNSNDNIENIVRSSNENKIGPDISEDTRLNMKRPFMTTTSQRFMNSIHDIENAFKPSSDCSEFGGLDFMNNLTNSMTSLLSDKSKSELIVGKYHDLEINVARNVRIVVDKLPNPPALELIIQSELHDDLNSTEFWTKQTKDLTVLEQMQNNVTIDPNALDQCKEFIEYPVLLVDSKVEHANWWFFLVELLQYYITVAGVQDLIEGNYGVESDLRVLYTFDDKQYQLSFTDAYEFLFSDRRTRDSRQIWKLEPQNDLKALGGSSNEHCFKTLIWSTFRPVGKYSLLSNTRHDNDHCFSSIIYSFASQLKASLHIPVLPKPEKPRVVWVARDTSEMANPTPWQNMRIFNNQKTVIFYLAAVCKKEGIDFIVADFYGEKSKTAFQEQALFVSRANIMIGMHGAGLNMFMFMPFNSVVVELHVGSTINQKNSVNFVNHITEGKYIPKNVFINRGQLRSGEVSTALDEAIAAWYKLSN